ncbi:aminomethyltransferase family protein [Jannaschia sp.]|nr:aminomethyltransferase family protein [Jannaschia sp.]
MTSDGIVREFRNGGGGSPARRFPGFPPRGAVETMILSSRAVRRIDLRHGDLLSLEPRGRASEVLALAFDDKGRDALPSLAMRRGENADLSGFDCNPLLGWLRAQGGEAVHVLAARVPLTELLAFRAAAACTLWLALPVAREALIAGDTPCEITVTIKRADSTLPSLPDPLGRIREEFTVPRGTARAYELRLGETVQIIDIEGQQCSDFMAFRSEDLARGREVLIDSTATRSMVRRALPMPGLFDKFFDADMRPMLQMVQDTCGRHDALGLACTARGYADRGFPGHLNCSDNISGATADYGVAGRAAWPAINFFWNTWLDAHSHQLMTEESHSRPGDYVALRALAPLLCVSTACPDDLDPINGWNPTDVHIRITDGTAPIQRAIAYRTREDAPMSISRESAFHSRTSALTRDFAPARDIWSPISYPVAGTIGEYWACREAVTLQDMSGLRKYDVIGPDAERLLQRAMTRDIARLAAHRGTYSLICDDTGGVIDDGTLFRLGPDLFRWCCGSEESVRALDALADGLDVRLRDMSDALVNLALQGPKSRDVLRGLIFTPPHVPDLEQVKWFGTTLARLGDREGAPFMLTRSGYTGELGYEIFCAPADAEAIWDALMEAGAPHGIVPMGSAALEILRIEAGLAAAGAEFAPGHDAFEAGLGFAVNLKKADFVGRAALARNAEAPRRVLRGLRFDTIDVPLHGAPVFAGERQIGQVTSATRSPMSERTLAMARLAVEYAQSGCALEVGMMDGRMKRLPCSVSDIPFHDPTRERARA